MSERDQFAAFGPKRTSSAAGSAFKGNDSSRQLFGQTGGRWRRSMMVLLGYCLSGAIAFGIIVIGARFLIAPYPAAAAYGVPVSPDSRWDAYLSVKAIRDIASGLFIAILMVDGSVYLLGYFFLAATLIPLTDALIVLKHGGTKAPAFGIHGATAGVMLIICGLLLWG
jgi:hypothetical protein